MRHPSVAVAKGGGSAQHLQYRRWDSDRISKSGLVEATCLGSWSYKLPNINIPPKANFLEIGSCNFQSQGTGKMSMAIFVASSDPVIPYENVFSLIHFPSTPLSQNAWTGTQAKTTANTKLIHQATQKQPVITATFLKVWLGNMRW